MKPKRTRKPKKKTTADPVADLHERMRRAAGHPDTDPDVREWALSLVNGEHGSGTTKPNIRTAACVNAEPHSIKPM